MDVNAHAQIIAHPADVPTVVAAMQAKVDYLVTLSRRHFINIPVWRNAQGCASARREVR
jgi:hypothetical protein